MLFAGNDDVDDNQVAWHEKGEDSILKLLGGVTTHASSHSVSGTGRLVRLDELFRQDSPTPEAVEQHSLRVSHEMATQRNCVTSCLASARAFSAEQQRVYQTIAYKAAKAILKGRWLVPKVTFVFC
jgi:hypothetical protein